MNFPLRAKLTGRILLKSPAPVYRCSDIPTAARWRMPNEQVNYRFRLQGNTQRAALILPL